MLKVSFTIIGCIPFKLDDKGQKFPQVSYNSLLNFWAISPDKPDVTV